MKFKHLRRLFESKADEQKLIDFVGEELAQKFFKLKDRLKAPENDLYYWIKQGDPQLLRDKLDDILSVKTRKEKDVEASEGAELIYDQDGWKVYHITTYEASVKYGKGTRWCISGSKVWDNGERGEEYFNKYTQKDGIEFYFYIRNNKEKYALAYYDADEDAFYQVFNAEDIDVTETVELPKVEGLPDFERIYDWIYDGSEKAPKNVKTAIVKNGVESIKNYAFAYCPSLINITIPNSVRSIGYAAFRYCTGLTNITIPNNVTSIDEYAFYDCRGLTSITIPDSVEFIGVLAFENCTNLTTVYYTGTEDQWAAIKIGAANKPLTDATIVYNHNSSKNTVTESINIDDDNMTETTTQIEKSDEGIKSLINDALKYCWGLYNSLTTLRINADAYGYKDIGENVKELEDSQYTNIGTLEGLLQTLDPNAETISDSSEEVVDEIEGAENG